MRVNRTRRRVGGKLTTAWSERAVFEESIRLLRSNLGVVFSKLQPPLAIVTSANAGEGKTLITSHLAASFARAGQRVVLVDLNFRHPHAHEVTGGHNESGATDVMLGRKALEECLQYLELPESSGGQRRGMYLLAAGSGASDPSELLGSEATGRMLDDLAQRADLVLIDTPPVLLVADTLVLGRMVSGAVLVSASGRTTLRASQRSKDLLTHNQIPLLGLVVNKFRGHVGDGYIYGYGAPPEPLNPAG